MSALPANLGQKDSLDPQRILRVLPDRERETFLAQYRRAVDGARSRWLEASATVSAAVGREGYQREPAGLLRGAGPGARRYRRGNAARRRATALPPGRVNYRPWLEGGALRQMSGLSWPGSPPTTGRSTSGFTHSGWTLRRGSRTRVPNLSC